MVVTAARVEEGTPRTRRALIDCDFHNELDSIKDLYPYLSQRWRDHIDQYGARGALQRTYDRFVLWQPSSFQSSRDSADGHAAADLTHYADRRDLRLHAGADG